MLLRDDRQMAISAVETLCFETADAYAAAASQTGTPPLAQLFDALAGQRRQLAAELAAHIRALDDLPQQPDPDREALGQVLSGLKALLSGDADGSLIHERLQGEDKLAAALRDALQHPLPPETHAMLDRIGAQVHATQQKLEVARR
ncbi:MAG TPA: DUF2383 domain-containing protein [Noviherbaspirillum sp.]